MTLPISLLVPVGTRSTASLTFCGDGDAVERVPTGFRETMRDFVREVLFLNAFGLAAALVLGLTLLGLAGPVLRRGAFGVFRTARRNARPAGFPAFAARGFFVFMPDNDPPVGVGFSLML